MGDVIVAVILTLTTVRGAFRGFIKTICEIVAILLAFWVGYSFRDNLVEYLVSLGLPFQSIIIQNVILALMIAIVLCVVTAIGNFLGNNIIPMNLLWIDKIGGIVTGLGLGFLSVGLILFYTQILQYGEMQVLSEISNTADAYFQGINEFVISLFRLITHNNG